jgi:hypothetical protein
VHNLRSLHKSLYNYCKEKINDNNSQKKHHSNKINITNITTATINAIFLPFLVILVTICTIWDTFGILKHINIPFLVSHAL